AYGWRCETTAPGLTRTPNIPVISGSRRWPSARRRSEPSLPCPARWAAAPRWRYPWPTTDEIKEGRPEMPDDGEVAGLIRVLLVDDHRVVRRGVLAYLE